jgi:hypothetical protein
MRLRTNGWGIVPADDELRSFVMLLSERHYGQHYLPSMHLFNSQRPAGWRQSFGILHAHQLPGTGAGWQALMTRLDLTTPLAPPGVAAQRVVRQHRRQGLLDAPLGGPGDPVLPSLAELSQLERGQGLPAIARSRPVRVWCPRRHCYVEVGQQTSWELR